MWELRTWIWRIPIDNSQAPKEMSSVRQATIEAPYRFGVAVIFKGAGFYETDYRSENYKNGEKDAKEKTKKKKEPAKSEEKKPKKKEKPGKDKKKTS